MIDIEVKAVTHCSGHHFFGFHDLVQWNAKGDFMLGLEVDDISRPPYPGDVARSGVIEPESGVFHYIHETSAFNYPQGARQQWVGSSDCFVCNDRVGDDWGSRLVDARSRKVEQSFPFPVHVLNADSGDAFSISYSRLHRVGGYGYVGVPDKLADEDIPRQCGIYRSNINSGRSELLVSIWDVASTGVSSPPATGYPHYLTHLVLSPERDRIAFLHRYRVVDGGEITRLMTVGVDGQSMRCLAKGFLSHFDWLDNKQIMIWGKHDSGVSRLRESALMRNKLFSQGVGFAKSILRGLRRSKKVAEFIQTKSFNIVTDSEESSVSPCGIGVLTEDGHPMTCPSCREWLVNDTYPDRDGLRTLMLYNWKKNLRQDLGRFRKLDVVPNLEEIDLDCVLGDVDGRIRKSFPVEKYCFTRSGYHCDLHPRWKSDGRFVAFDSIHEGSRQVYVADVSKLTQQEVGVV